MKTKMHRIVPLALAGFLAALAAHGQKSEEKEGSFLDIGSIYTERWRNIIVQGGMPGGTAANVKDPSVADLRLSRVGNNNKSERVRNAGSVSPGDKARVCFNVNRNGYVSMWSLDAKKNLSRILPNKFMPGAGNGVKVSGGNEYCATGDGMTKNNEQMEANNRWWFEVVKPLGKAEVFLYWTGTLDQQVAEDSFVDVDALGRALTRSLQPRADDSRENRLRGGGLTIFYSVK